ncbi:MAG: hypothetical protein JNL72_04005 [Flavipsychrobacter sp.]|nr:hypothetical protein [Flavipsychrobacter sp.]
MHKQRKFIIAAAAIGLVATFLPWITATAGGFGYSISRSRNGFHGAGIFYFMLLLAAAVICFTGDKMDTLAKNMRLAVISCGAVGLICILLVFGNANSEIGSYGVDVGPSIGAFLAFLSAAGLVAIPLIIKKAGESLGADLANLKGGVQALQQDMATKNTSRSQLKLDEMEKLINWRNEGKISQQEFEELKSKIM